MNMEEWMKSNQRWLKLRTTVQLSGALSSSMNRAKPPLKREDSFIKRFSTRQIAELQDTVDQTDEEDVSKNSTGSPKVRKKKKQRQPRTVINPYGNLYFYWLCSLTICVLYNLWTPIVRQAFPELQLRPQPMWYLLDGLTDLVFVLDIMVQFRTGYLEQGLIVYDFRKLARHYMQSRSFILDIVSLIPLDFLQLLLGPQPIIRFPRFIKVYRVYNYYYMVESRTLYPNMWRVVNLIHILLLLAHWFGCFYYMLSEAEQFMGDWVYPYRESPDFRSLSRMYLGSVYWSTLTLTTIGDLPTPETNRQYIFTIVSYLIGVFIFATIVGQVGNVITNRNANRLEFERLLDGAKLYMRHHKVPRAMQRRVQRWYDYSWSRGRIQGGGDINTALGLLPDKLKTELALHVNLLTLKKVSIFKECQPEFLHDLVLKMKAYIFTPGDLICRKGEVAREMFIIADGILEVISETGKVLTTMKAGDFFGEIGILNLDGLNKRTADVRSVGYSELFSLSREDVLMAMKDYPEAQEILQSLGRKRLMEARHHSKSGSSGSSKRGTPSPSKDGGPDDKNAKKIVSRLKSDVSAIRNAFRRSRGTTKYTETLEQDLLTERKRISGRSGSDSSTGTRGVLKRMARVTSDEVTQAATSPARDNEEPQGLLGAGLPLLQRLKLLKEKEEKEDKERQLRIKEEEESKTEGKPEPPQEEEKEPEVIGAGLPLFARLRLLAVKEEKERLEREEREKAEKEKAEAGPPLGSTEPTKKEDKITKTPAEHQGNVEQDKQSSDSKPEVADTKPRQMGSLKGRLRAAMLTKAPPSPPSSIMKVTPPREITSSTGTETTTSVASTQSTPTTTESKQTIVSDPKLSAINDLNKGIKIKVIGDEKVDEISDNKPPPPKDLHTNSNSVQGGQALERAFGKLLSKKLNTSPKERTSVPVIENQVIDDVKVQNTTIKDKISRSDSFKKAMDEGLIKSTEVADLNIKDSNGTSSVESSKDESGVEEMEEEKEKMSGSHSGSHSENERELKEIKEEESTESEEKVETEEKNDRLEKMKKREDSSKLLRSLTTRQHHRVDSLKDDVEVAWVQRVEELQYQLAARDATIRQLTNTITRLQANAGDETRVGEGSHQSGGLVKCPSISRSSSDGSIEGSDEDEPLFMRCNSIESIIHHSPEETSDGSNRGLRPSWRRQASVIEQRPHHTRPDHRGRSQVVLDIGSSTDEELYSFDSEEDHVVYGDLMGNTGVDSFENEMSDGVEEEDIFPVLDDDEDDDEECDVEQGDSGEAELSSQDWEVQLLAKQLAEEQRGVARLIDRDIAEGRFDSALGELHEALASDNLGPLSDIDLARLEKAVRREREKLRRYARMYSLDERPVLEDQFTSLYRSRSQLLLNRSSELCRAGPTERRLSLLLEQLTKMPLEEQFLLDRLVYTTARRRKLSRQRSLCDEQLSSYDTIRTPISNKSKFSLAARRSMSVCSPPPESSSTVHFREEPLVTVCGSGGDTGPPTVSAMLASLQRSVVAISTQGRGSGSSQGSHKEGAPLLRPPPR